MTSPCFTGEKVIGAILFERTMDGMAGGKPVPELLWERGVVPFLKVDKGLEDEADGVKLMKPIGGLGALLERAKAKGVFGTKMRSVIERASPTGIAAIVAQQFAVAAEISRHGLMPIIEPEVSIKSPERAECDWLLRDELLKALDAVPQGERVMLKLTIPAEAGLYDALVGHRAVLKLVALSGGFSRQEACRELAKNKGMIASFSRALLSDLKDQMSDEEFNASLGGAIKDIHEASTVKA
jgi:fructose-bisphosphate aldolase class I